jgi:hypothetical protein
LRTRADLVGYALDRELVKAPGKHDLPSAGEAD